MSRRREENNAAGFHPPEELNNSRCSPEVPGISSLPSSPIVRFVLNSGSGSALHGDRMEHQEGEDGAEGKDWREEDRLRELLDEERHHEDDAR